MSVLFDFDKANGDVARLELVGDAFNVDANFGKSVKLKQNTVVIS